MVSTMSDGWKFEQVTRLLGTGAMGEHPQSCFHVLRPPRVVHLVLRRSVSGCDSEQKKKANAFSLIVRARHPGIPPVL